MSSVYIVKSQTLKHKPNYNTFYFVSKSSKIDKKGLTRQRGEDITLSIRSHCKSFYPELPNGKYYEYSIVDHCLKNKQCKQFTLVDKKADHEQLVGVQIFESISAEHITQESSFNVKGGVVTLVPINNPQTSSTKISNEKFMKFIESHRSMKNLDVRSYFYFRELYNKCQRLDVGIPYKAKDLISNVYRSHDERSKKVASKEFVNYSLDSPLKR